MGVGRPRHRNLHTHGPRNPPGSPTTPGQGAARQPRLPARHSSESRGDKSGRATSGEPPLGSSPRETDGEPLPRAQLLLRHPVPQQSVSRASSTSLFLRPRPDNRANSVSGDRGAPAWQQGSPGLSQLARSRSPSGGRGSRPRPRPTRVGAPPAPPAAGRARGSEGQAATSGSGQRRPGASLTFVALQHILVRLHELLLLAAVGRLLTRHVAGHGCPRRALPGPRGAPAPGPRAEAAAAAPASAFVRFGGGGSLGSPALGSESVSPGPAVALGCSSALSHQARSRSAGPGSRFRLPTPRLRSSLSPPRRDGGGGASCQERQAGPVPRPSALRLRRRARLSPRPQPAGPGGPPTTARAGRGRERSGEQAGLPTGGPGSVRTRGPAGGSGRETPGPTQAEPQPHSALPYTGSRDKGGSHGLCGCGRRS